MQKMQEETSGSLPEIWCIPYRKLCSAFIQLPILLALYQVIQNIPAYVGSVKNVFNGVLHKILV